MITFVKVFLTGWIVLVAAIVINTLADIVGLTGWYAFLDGERAGALSVIFLFFLYPSLLGLAAILPARALIFVDKGRA